MRATRVQHSGLKWVPVDTAARSRQSATQDDLEGPVNRGVLSRRLPQVTSGKFTRRAMAF
jgi:hypothetical protein